MTPDHMRPQTRQHETINHAGGGAWSQSAEHELASLVLTSFVQDQYYRGADETLARLRALARVVDPRFVARLALFARREFQLRAISHVLAAEVAELAKGEQWTRGFYRDLVVRADDVTAILAQRQAAYGLHPLPNSLKRGLADALRLQDEYGLGKYAAGTGRIHMVDAVNLCRPMQTPALRALMTGALAAPDTWEVALTRAGQAAASAEEARALKAAAWERLVAEDHLGYMALLRNLRNIAEYCGPEVRELAASRIADPSRVHASRQLPFRFASALKALEDDRGESRDAVLGDAVAAAMEIALDNVPAFAGRTLVAVDASGSMLGGWVVGERRAPIETATIFAAALARKSSADVMLFDTRVQWLAIDPSQSIAAISASIMARVMGGGTDFHLIFEHARERYDRIVILSDMQAWVPRPRTPLVLEIAAEEAPEPTQTTHADADAAEEARRTVDDLYDEWDAYLTRNGGVPAAGIAPPVRVPKRAFPATAALPTVWASSPSSVRAAYAAYRRRTGADPAVFCFDLQGYGSTQFVDGRVVQLAGFSERVFDLIPLFERGGDALVETIEAVEL